MTWSQKNGYADMYINSSVPTPTIFSSSSIFLPRTRMHISSSATNRERNSWFRDGEVCDTRDMYTILHTNWLDCRWGRFPEVAVVASQCRAVQNVSLIFRQVDVVLRG